MVRMIQIESFTLLNSKMLLTVRLTCLRNRGELAEGWYDPLTLEKARLNALHIEPRPTTVPRELPNTVDHNSEEDEYGPALPNPTPAGMLPGDLNPMTHGPAQPHLQDLQVKREMAVEEAAETRRNDFESMRNERRAHRVVQKERLEELAPRAEAGTRERQLEKKREKADSHRTFAASAHDNADVEVKDADLMGDGGGIDDLKRMKQAEERKRSEREIRREETQAARRAETEERVKVMREKENKTMSMLQELARARFGNGM